MAKHLPFGIPAFTNRGTRTGTGFMQVGALNAPIWTFRADSGF